MLCEKPIFAYRDSWGVLNILSDDERDRVRDGAIVKFEICRSDSRASPLATYPVFRFPCGKCLLCRASHRAEWTLRCWLESQQHENNLFITLTYNDEHKPENGVSKDEIAKFMHNLRQYFQRSHKHLGIRFFGCGEYGESALRPHYHLLLFNCPHFGDEEACGTNDFGHTYYKSERLEQLWGKGICKIGFMENQPADYVARYILKLDSPPLPKHFNPTFINMSRKRGIGLDYLNEHLDQIIAEDSIPLPNGKTRPLPRYFNKKLVEYIGADRYTAEIAGPRADRIKGNIAKEMARTGLSQDELYQHQVEQAKQKIQCIRRIVYEGKHQR